MNLTIQRFNNGGLTISVLKGPDSSAQGKAAEVAALGNQELRTDCALKGRDRLRSGKDDRWKPFRTYY